MLATTSTFMQRIIDYFKNLGVDENTTATILITLFTFSAGLFISWVAKQLKNQKEKNSYKKSLLFILKDFKKDCEKQHLKITDSLKTVGFKTGNDFKITYIPIGSLSYLNNLDFNVFLKNFEPLLFRKLFSKAISKLIGIIAIIKIQNETFKERTNEFSKSYSKHEEQYYSNIEELRRFHEILGAKYNGVQLERDKSGDLIVGYFKIFGDWVRAGAKKEIESTYTEIVKKILELNKKHGPNLLTLESTNYAIKCEIAYINIEKIENILHEIFKPFAYDHHRASKLLTVIIRILK